MLTSYASVLIRYIGICYGLPCLIALGFVLLPIIKLSRKNKSTAKSDEITGRVIIAVLILGFLAYKSVPALIDINNDGFKSCHGTIDIGSTRTSTYMVVYTDDGEKIRLDFPKFNRPNREAVHYEGYDATVWYSEKSGYFLDFELDRET